MLENYKLTIMKELSIEQKARAYDEAVKRAKELLEIGVKDARDKRVVLSFFPELKESEGEEIRKDIISYIKAIANNENISPDSKKECKTWIAWLEKQGEQKPFDYENANIQQKDFAPKVEPKFKNGQWIVWQDKYYKVNYNGCGYELVDQNGLITSLEYGTIEENAHLWTIKDAKDGDVLVDRFSKDNIIILYKGINHKLSVLAYCGWNGYNLSIKTNGLGYGNLDNTNYYPATKEQRDTLMKAMTDTGYTFDFEKKQLKLLITNGDDFFESENCEQKHVEWSEEDERICNNIINDITNDKSICKYEIAKGICDAQINWLKSLKERMADNHPNLTWEDIRKICLIAKNVHKYYGFWTQNIYEEILDRFNKPEVWT